MKTAILILAMQIAQPSIVPADAVMTIEASKMERPVVIDEHRKKRWAALIGAQLLDAVSTDYALAHGARELNPVMQKRAVRYGSKIAIGVGQALIMDVLARRGKTKAANVTSGIFAGTFTGIAIWNVSQAQ